MARISSVTTPSARRTISSRTRRSSGPDALDRADRPAEHVVAAAELAGLLDRDDVLGLLDHADDRQVAPRVAADPALLGLGDVAADAAEPHLVLDLGQRADQPAHVDRVGGEQVERDALRALGPDAGQPAELVDQVLDRALVHLRTRAGPCRPSLPTWGPCLSAATAWALAAASRTAATTRSCRVSTSSGSTTDGAISTLTRSPVPVTTALTRPPAVSPLDLGLGQLGLGGHHLLLHLLRLRHELLQVGLGGHRARSPLARSGGTLRAYVAGVDRIGSGARRVVAACGAAADARQPERADPRGRPVRLGPVGPAHAGRARSPWRRTPRGRPRPACALGWTSVLVQRGAGGEGGRAAPVPCLAQPLDEQRRRRPARCRGRARRTPRRRNAPRCRSRAPARAAPPRRPPARGPRRRGRACR